MTQLLFLASPEFECHSLWTRFGSGDLNAFTYKMSTERDEDFPSSLSRHPFKLARPAPHVDYSKGNPRFARHWQAALWAFAFAGWGVIAYLYHSHPYFP